MVYYKIGKNDEFVCFLNKIYFREPKNMQKTFLFSQFIYADYHLYSINIFSTTPHSRIYSPQ